MGLKFARDNSASGHRNDNTNDRTALEIYRAATLCKFQIALLAQFSKELCFDICISHAAAACAAGFCVCDGAICR
jgi:hypothetical protein